MYGDGPPGSQPVTIAPGVRRQERRRARAGPGGADDVDPLAGPDRPRAGRGPAPARRRSRSAAAVTPDVGDGSPSSRSSSSSRAAAALRRLFVGPVAGPDVPPDGRRRPRRRPRRRSGRPVWLGVPPSGPGDPGHRDREVRAGPRAAAGRHRDRDLRGDRAVRRQDVRRDADQLALERRPSRSRSRRGSTRSSRGPR